MKKDKKKTLDKMISRYGKFMFKAYSNYLLFVPIILIFLVIQNLVEPLAAIAFELVLVFICILTHYEKYQLREDVIDSKKIFNKKSIFLPKDLLLIVAKTDILGWGNWRLNTLRKNVVEYDDRYMICICASCSVNNALQVIHQYDYPKGEQYYNEAIKASFKKTAYHDFLYSFVFDVEQLQKLVANHNCQIILPKSLEGKVDLSGINVPIHVDEEG